MSEVQNPLNTEIQETSVNPELTQATDKYSHIMLKLIMDEIFPGNRMEPGVLVEELGNIRSANDDYYK